MNTAEILNEVMSGNLKRFYLLVSITQNKLLESSGILVSLILTKLAVLAALEGLKNCNVTSEVAKKWASFMRRGYMISSESTPISPLEIEYIQPLKI